MKIFSIAVCTFNREDQLSILLAQLEQMSTWLDANAELIIIDNNSSDNTQTILRDYQKKFNFRVIKEPSQGLSFARNRALKEFVGDALLFLDDDINIPLSALKAYLTLLESEKNIDYIGGKITVDWQGNTPAWLKEGQLVLLDGLFGNYNLGRGQFVYSDSDPNPFGANFVLRRTLIERVGLFDVSLGVVGNHIGRGEETDYFNRARALGFDGLYSGECHVGHRFQKDRISIMYLYQYGYQKGRAVFLIDGSESKAWFISTLGFFFKGVYQLIKFRRDRFYQCVINIGIRRGLYCESKYHKLQKNEDS